MKFELDGGFVLDSELKTLFDGAIKARLTPKYVAVLQMLVENPDKRFSKDELLDGVWKNSSVDPHRLESAMSSIRKALRDDSRNPRYIHYDRDTGVRFIGSVFQIPSRAPVSVSTVEGDQSLQERLVAWGAPANEVLRSRSVLQKLNSKFVIGDVVLDAGFAGFHGVAEHEIEVLPAIHGWPRLPDYVYERRKNLPTPPTNKSLVYLEDWVPAIIDRGNVVSFRLGSADGRVIGNKYDYWTTSAVIQEVARIQRDLIEGRLRVGDFGRRLDVILTVITADDQLVLARRGEHVENEKGKWMSSVGETADQDKDVDQHGILNPIETVRRCLREYDELNLSARQAQTARIRVLGLATEWSWMYANILTLVELPTVTFDELNDRSSRGEHQEFTAIPFTLESCLPLIRKGFDGVRGNDATELEGASRMSLFLSLMARFTYNEVNRLVG